MKMHDGLNQGRFSAFYVGLHREHSDKHVLLLALWFTTVFSLLDLQLSLYLFACYSERDAGLNGLRIALMR